MGIKGLKTCNIQGEVEKGRRNGHNQLEYILGSGKTDRESQVCIYQTLGQRLSMEMDKTLINWDWKLWLTGRGGGDNPKKKKIKRVKKKINSSS